MTISPRFGAAWRNTVLTVVDTDEPNATFAFEGEAPLMQYNFRLQARSERWTILCVVLVLVHTPPSYSAAAMVTFGTYVTVTGQECCWQPPGGLPMPPNPEELQIHSVPGTLDVECSQLFRVGTMGFLATAVVGSHEHGLVCQSTTARMNPRTHQMKSVKEGVARNVRNEQTRSSSVRKHLFCVRYSCLLLVTILRRGLLAVFSMENLSVHARQATPDISSKVIMLMLCQHVSVLRAGSHKPSL